VAYTTLAVNDKMSFFLEVSYGNYTKEALHNCDIYTAAEKDGSG